MSFTALNFWTKTDGIEQAMYDLVKRIEEERKIEVKTEVNNEIVSELNVIRDMLNQKSKGLN
jgi:hypothetical protein